jgi:hypothetical protein
MDEWDEDWGEVFAGMGEEWSVIERVLPAGWEEAARRTGALNTGAWI